MMTPSIVTVSIAATVTCFATHLGAQTAGSDTARTPPISAASLPILHSIEAYPAAGPITLDGRLDEPAWRVYLGACLHDSDPNGIVVNDIRKDFYPEQQDDFEVIVGTCHDIGAPGDTAMRAGIHGIAA